MGLAIDQRRKTHQGLAATAHFQQLRQFAEGPIDMALGSIQGRRGTGSFFLGLGDACGFVAGCGRGCNSSSRRHLPFDLRQCRKRRPGLTAEFAFKRRQVAPHGELATMLVHHPEVHEEVGREAFQFEVAAFDLHVRGLAHGFE